MQHSLEKDRVVLSDQKRDWKTMLVSGFLWWLCTVYEKGFILCFSSLWNQVFSGGFFHCPVSFLWCMSSLFLQVFSAGFPHFPARIFFGGFLNFLARFSPVVFFIVSASSDPSLVQVELLTYNEQVFQVTTDGWISLKSFRHLQAPILKYCLYFQGSDLRVWSLWRDAHIHGLRASTSHHLQWNQVNKYYMHLYNVVRTEDDK